MKVGTFQYTSNPRATSFAGVTGLKLTRETRGVSGPTVERGQWHGSDKIFSVLNLNALWVFQDAQDSLANDLRCLSERSKCRYVSTLHKYASLGLCRFYNVRLSARRAAALNLIVRQGRDEAAARKASRQLATRFLLSTRTKIRRPIGQGPVGTALATFFGYVDINRMAEFGLTTLPWTRAKSACYQPRRYLSIYPDGR